MATKKKKFAPVTAEATVFVSKLGAAKGVARSRIWIEGKRLAEIGFVPGAYFVKEWGAHADATKGHVPGASFLELTLLKGDEILATAPCKVSGKGDKPIIDITGEKVREAFGEFEKVSVSYIRDSKGSRIYIRGLRGV
jgi:hypothetical protein